MALSRQFGLCASVAVKYKGTKKISYKGYRFPPEIIQQAIWLYLPFTRSFRDVKRNAASWSPTKLFGVG
jgi:hypothetical protein